jgi:signal peptide peptidase SppA
MKKTYYHISAKLYSEPWAIMPTTYQSIVKQFEAHIKGQMPIDDMDEPDEEDDMQMADVINGAMVIPVQGILTAHASMLETMCGACDTDTIASQLKAAMADDSITRVIMWFRTPGGSVAGIQELASLIKTVNQKKQCIAYCDDLCCSAGYWLASQCSAIYTTPSATIGSVGCYIYLEEYTKAMLMEGITANPIVSDNSPMKVAGAPYKQLTDEERAMFKADVNRIYDKFVEDILSNRSIDKQYLDGRVFDGETAVSINMTDGTVNDMDELLQVV